jgi:hypothetical protein
MINSPHILRAVSMVADIMITATNVDRDCGDESVQRWSFRDAALVGRIAQNDLGQIRPNFRRRGYQSALLGNTVNIIFATL